MINLLAELLLPPFNVLLLATFAGLIGRRRPRLGRTLLIGSLVAGYLLCTSVLTGSGLRHLEGRISSGETPALPAENAQAATEAVAIVVLGSGSYFNAPEYGGDTVSASTLERLRWAARLHRDSQIPILVSGGNPLGNTPSEAEQMRDALVEDFVVPVQWVETRARNTYESAYQTLAMLGAPPARIMLVTHAAHMPRAVLVFSRAGFDVIPSATGFTTSPPASIRDFLPNATGLIQARIFFHEVIGIGWYHLRLAVGV